jgi:hypothetical protein
MNSRPVVIADMGYAALGKQFLEVLVYRVGIEHRTITFHE